MLIIISSAHILILAFWQTQGSRPGQSDESLSHALLDKFVEAGGNFIDTADVYQFGVSESIIGMTALFSLRKLELN